MIDPMFPFLAGCDGLLDSMYSSTRVCLCSAAVLQLLDYSYRVGFGR